MQPLNCPQSVARAAVAECVQRSPPLESLNPQTIGEIGRLLVSAEILKRGIGVAKPEQDTGFDIVSISRTRTCRIQIKTRHSLSDGPSERFSVRRYKGVTTRKKTYDDGEVDVFVFASLATGAFWVVPSASIDLDSHNKSFRTDSEWFNAWHVLGEGHAA